MLVLVSIFYIKYHYGIAPALKDQKEKCYGEHLFFSYSKLYSLSTSNAYSWTLFLNELSNKGYQNPEIMFDVNTMVLIPHALCGIFSILCMD
jgi:hypothetical protein